MVSRNYIFILVFKVVWVNRAAERETHNIHLFSFWILFGI